MNQEVLEIITDFLNFVFRPPLVTDRRPTVSWSWQEKSTTENSTPTSNFYFPSSSANEMLDFDDFETSTTIKRPTR